MPSTCHPRLTRECGGYAKDMLTEDGMEYAVDKYGEHQYECERASYFPRSESSGAPAIGMYVLELVYALLKAL